MARHEIAEHAERLTGAERLAALRLPTRSSGWVPEDATQPGEASDLPPSAASPAPVGVSPIELVRGWAKDRTSPWLHGAIDRATIGSVVTGLAALIAVIIAVVMVVHRHASPAYPASYSSATSSTTSGAATSSSYPVPSADPVTTEAASIVVDVSGRVRRPGLVTLPAGARVADAIAAAGGPLRHRELATTNLAARVTDGQLLTVGTKQAAAPSAPTTDASSTSTGPSVDLNSATLEELETLPGVGPVTGQKIIDWRTAHSGFTSIEQLQQVSGIGPATYAELSPLVTL